MEFKMEKALHRLRPRCYILFRFSIKTEATHSTDSQPRKSVFATGEIKNEQTRNDDAVFGSDYFFQPKPELFQIRDLPNVETDDAVAVDVRVFRKAIH
jgi:hypothetical protein